MKKILALLALGMFLAPSAHAAFDTDLRYGSSGAPVFELQEFLTAQGVYSGPITGNFYSLTLAGVKALQAKLNVEPQSGFFGPLTREAAGKVLSKDLAESDKEASSTPVVVADDKPQRTERNTGGTGGTGTVSQPLQTMAEKHARTGAVRASLSLDDDGKLSLSITDYFEDETVSYSSDLATLNSEVTCEQKVAGTDLHLCATYVTFETPKTYPANVTVSFDGESQVVPLNGPRNVGSRNWFIK